MTQETDKKCFVITPIGNETDSIRRHIDGIIDAVISPVLDQKYKINVAHRMANPGSINRQILQEIYESDLVVANLTEKNPNVMYELAFRHSLGTPCIIIAEVNTDLPFDINGERTIFYINDSQGVIELKEKLKECEASIEFESDKKVGPIYEALREIIDQKNIIENIESQSIGDIDILKHILNRLDEIDKKILRPNNSYSSIQSNEYLFNDDGNSMIQNIKFSPKLSYELDRKHPTDLIRQAVRDIRNSIINKYDFDAKQLHIRVRNGELLVLTGQHGPDNIDDMNDLIKVGLDNYGIEIKSIRRY